MVAPVTFRAWCRTGRKPDPDLAAAAADPNDLPDHLIEKPSDQFGPFGSVVSLPGTGDCIAEAQVADHRAAG